jgi:hypothetical protein
MATKVSATFSDPETAKRAVRALLDESVPLERIHVFLGAGDDARPVRLEQNNLVFRGSVIGGVLGTVVGLATLILMVSGVLRVPGVGFSDTAWLAIVQGGAIGLLLGWVTGVIMGLGAWRVEIDLPKGQVDDPIRVDVEPFVKRVDTVRATLERMGGRVS